MTKSADPTPEPLVSVVMAVFNEERHLEAAIRSILEQSLKEFEFIIVDDGSTDGTAVVLEKFAREPRMKVIRLEQHRGLPVALNVGLESARAPLIARMDADDEAMPNRLRAQKKAFDEHQDIDVCGTNAEVIRPFWYESPELDQQPLIDDGAIRLNFLHRSGIVHPSVMFRRYIGGFAVSYDETFEKGQDYELWTRLAFYHSARFRNLPEKLIRYRAKPYCPELRALQEQAKFRVFNRTLNELGLEASEGFLDFLRWTGERLRPQQVDAKLRILLDCSVRFVAANDQRQLFDRAELRKHLLDRLRPSIDRVAAGGGKAWQRIDKKKLYDLGISDWELKNIEYSVARKVIWQRLTSLPVLGFIFILILALFRPQIILK